MQAAPEPYLPGASGSPVCDGSMGRHLRDPMEHCAIQANAHLVETTSTAPHAGKSWKADMKSAAACGSRRWPQSPGLSRPAPHHRGRGRADLRLHLRAGFGPTPATVTLHQSPPLTIRTMRRHDPMRALVVIGFLIALALQGSGCARANRPAHVRAIQDAAATPPVVPNLFDVQRQVEHYLDSGKYDADVTRVAGEAQGYLEQRAGSATKPAIVLDIDETSLSNWPAYRINGWGRVVNGECDLQQGPCGLRAWQALGRSTALQPTLQLARRAKAVGVAVFFMSGRSRGLREGDERNLGEQGYQWDQVIIFPEGARFTSAVDFKAPERRKITERGYTILLTMGDQESDLAGGYAERTFKLPNPVYFIP